MAPSAMPTTRYCFPLARLLILIWLSCGCCAVHFDNGFSDKILIDAQQKVVQMRTKRETPVKHKTQHLKPAIEIEPINEKIRVAMPHFDIQELTAYANQAAAVLTTRFEEFEPTLLASNGKFARHRATRESSIAETGGKAKTVRPNQPVGIDRKGLFSHF